MDKKGSQVTTENQGPITILSYRYDVVCFSSRILLSIAHVFTVSPLHMIVLLDEMVKKHLIFPYMLWNGLCMQLSSTLHTF